MAGPLGKMAANRQEAISLLVEEREQIILPAKFVDPGANDDADDVVEWSASFQWRIVALLALAAFTVYVQCWSHLPPPARQPAPCRLLETDDGHVAPSTAYRYFPSPTPSYVT